MRATRKAKRGIVGSFHKVGAKYVLLHVAEFQFRYNHRRYADIFGAAVEECKHLKFLRALLKRRAEITSIPATENKTMPTTTLSKRVKMIWGLSLHGWEDAMRFSLAIIGIFGLIVGLSTWFVVKLQRAEIEHSREEFETFKLESSERLAESNARQKEAELKLAELRDKVGRPRRIDAEILKTALESVPRRPIVLSSVEKDPDSIWLAMSMSGALEKAGWQVTHLVQMPEFIKLCSGDFGGIYVMTKALLPEEIKFFEEMFAEHTSLPNSPNTAFLRLTAALRAAIGDHVFNPTCPSIPDDKLYVAIWPRWIVLPKDGGK